MKCELCGWEVSGDIEVSSETLPNGVHVVSLTATPDRNWIACDACAALVCDECCAYPESGYCDSCIVSHKLYGYLVEVGLIKEIRLSNRDSD
jgi:hypothetical protein